jgi:hypothetical protein
VLAGRPFQATAKLVKRIAASVRQD